MTSRVIGVPVGLFGAHRKTTSGSASATWDAALSASTVKSAARVPAVHVAPVARVSSGYIE